MPGFEDETHFFPLKEGDPHYEAVGRVASAWALFEFHVNQLIWTMSATDDERGACVTSQIYSINARMKALLSLVNLEYEAMPEEIQKGTDSWAIDMGGHTFPNLIDRLKKFASRRVEGLSEQRNRIIHDTWMYGETTGAIAQIRATANRKLDYGFRPASIDAVNKTHQDIKRLDGDFLILSANIQASMMQIRLALRPQQRKKSRPRKAR